MKKSELILKYEHQLTHKNESEKHCFRTGIIHPLHVLPTRFRSIIRAVPGL
jgi:hypothetical protein